MTYDPVPSDGLPANEVAVLFLSDRPGTLDPKGRPMVCPVTPADESGQLELATSGKTAAFHIVSDMPLNAYDLYPYGGAHTAMASSTLLFPSPSWGNNYLTIAPVGGPVRQGIGQPWLTLVGSADNTQVTIFPRRTLPAGGALPKVPAGQSTSLVIQAGEVFQWLGADTTGTIVQSTQPVGVFAGYPCAFVQTVDAKGACDGLHMQLTPVGALGNAYVGSGIVTRLLSLDPESVPYQLMGIADDTSLTWDPPSPPDAPSTIALGQVVNIETPQLFSVHSQDTSHPFLMTQYMPGAIYFGRDCDKNGLCVALGDPEWLGVVPPAQYLRRYVFFVDPTYGWANLVVTRARDTQGMTGFADVNIDCVGTVTGWLPVGNNSDYEVAYVDLVRKFQPVGNCATSRHEATSTAPFGLTVWGTDDFNSYGYPAGGNVASINPVVVVPPK